MEIAFEGPTDEILGANNGPQFISEQVTNFVNADTETWKYLGDYLNKDAIISIKPDPAGSITNFRGVELGETLKKFAHELEQHQFWGLRLYRSTNGINFDGNSILVTTNKPIVEVYGEPTSKGNSWICRNWKVQECSNNERSSASFSGSLEHLVVPSKTFDDPWKVGLKCDETTGILPKIYEALKIHYIDAGFQKIPFENLEN